METVQSLQSRFSGGVLAGGLGVRVGGADKGWLDCGGRPLIAHVAAALRPQVAELLISANRNLEAYARLADTVVTDDGDPGEGPLAGLVRLLGAATRPWLLCVPCDAPTLPGDLGFRLWQCAQAQGRDLAVLADGEGWHPTFCLVRTTLAADARAAFAGGERAPRRWMSRHDPAVLVMPAPPNLNTPAGIAAAEVAG